MSLLRSETGKIHICGHRGHSVGAPENTLAAFRMAKSLGGTFCETDLALTQDGELVLIHDQTVDRTTDGKGLVAGMTLAELASLDAGGWFGAEFAGEPIPTLRDALALARDIGLMLQVELKIYGRDDALLPPLAALLDEMDAHELVQFSSFDFRQLREAKRQIPKVRTVGITHSRLIDPVATARATNLDAINIEIQHFPSGEALELHEAGIAAFLYVPRPEKIARDAAYGLDIEGALLGWVEDGRIDQLCGDDVGWLTRFVSGEPWSMQAE
ncbi:glycerophosphodiester phosphodiesterase family protein [Kaistia dalseonensis]|uniref:Glycerophosphoryl diester phosphodiesterase n=1 Tax=Kaistia dalseonensis TaxID=410840 RepID=A0ABU0H2K1_9HYPH|nr:glycerophosphodiester phosphodiesterase family protein [Kaistia dalseonensis]MCX5493723.1 glycerophosphodiester phosphodiesterase family protein [Kaistia dalseonensis]MDQ0436287.1 glycerophosphoryl diester phosphodiesterase [Kaistia dalseonensis]